MPIGTEQFNSYEHDEHMLLTRWFFNGTVEAANIETWLALGVVSIGQSPCQALDKESLRRQGGKFAWEEASFTLRRKNVPIVTDRG